MQKPMEENISITFSFLVKEDKHNLELSEEERKKNFEIQKSIETDIVKKRIENLFKPKTGENLE